VPPRSAFRAEGDDAAVNAAFEALKAQGQPVGEEKSSY